MTFSIRSIRFRNTALIDYFSTILLSFVLSAYMSLPVTLITIFLFSLSIILHFCFAIKTETNEFIIKTYCR